MIVAFDFDGVGYWFGESVRRYMKTLGMNPAPATDEFCAEWTFHEQWGVGRDEFEQICSDGVDAGIIFGPGDGLTRPGFFETVRRVKESGHVVLGITHRYQGSPGNAERNTYAWLGDDIIYFDDVIFSEDKTSVWSDMMVEDNLQNYDALISAGTNAFLINRPWNYVPGVPDSRHRISSVSEFGDMVASVTESGFRDLSIV